MGTTTTNDPTTTAHAQPRIGWGPPPDLRSHADERLESDRILFTTPPPEIGRVVSAFSDVRASNPPPTTATWIMRAIAVGGGVVVAGLLGMLAIGMPWSPGGVWMMGAGAVVAALTAWAWRFVGHCTYVGEDGIAYDECLDRLDRIKKTQVLLFARAASLHVRQTRSYQNGIYRWTSYAYVWKDARGRSIHQIAGTHTSEKADPPPTDAWHFAAAAERAWSKHRVGRLQADLGRQGFVSFPSEAGEIRVAPGMIEIVDGRGSHHLSPDDVERFVLFQGSFEIRARGAKGRFPGFFRDGVYRFSYDSVGNAQLLLYCVEQLTGVAVQ